MRFLNESRALGPTLWKHVKPLVRQVQSPAGVLIVDDSFLHKPHSQPNALVKTYFDHSQQAYVKAIRFLTLLYRVDQALLPVGLHVVTNTLQEPAPGETPLWRAAKTKNSHTPPSSDGLQKKPAFPRVPGEKKPGGQTGHPGQTLARVAVPDVVIVHGPLMCTCCGKSLKDALIEQTLGERQVVDMPAPGWS